MKLLPDAPHAVAVAVARALVDGVRAGEPAPEDWAAAMAAGVAARRAMRLRRVINATGVVLHTNLGRAPLSPRAAEAAARLAQGYVNLELDLETGERGERAAGIAGPLRALTGAEAAVAVNNNAAAVLLMLTALAKGREVVVSRGELVEIGGGFRVPEVIASGGARLVEVGTTNRTRARDYAAAIGPETAAILRVHPSNFRVVGFTESASRAELAELACERGILLLEDLGSGALVEGLGEPTVREVLAAGVDVACFSGDKLLGGPQAGVAAGRAELVAKLRRHPLYRALRLDRLVLAALEATLRDVEAGEDPPAVAMLRLSTRELKARAQGWVDRLRDAGVEATVLAGESMSGGGTVPGQGLPTWVAALHVGDPDATARALRTGEPAVMARVAEGRVLLDPRCVMPDEDEALIGAVIAASAG